MKAPRLLDLFCGAGGACRGYQLAGFHVSGIDIRPQPRYCGEAFHQVDALEFLADHGREFDVIHASPPCQAYTVLKSTYPDPDRHKGCLPEIRAALIAIGRPWIIENVVGAPMQHHVTLCGTMFNLRTYRHRRFEASDLIWQPPHPKHLVPATGNGGNRQRKHLYQNCGYHATITGDGGSHWGDAMGIGWMTGKELSQAIPPAYSEYISRQMRRVL